LTKPFSLSETTPIGLLGCGLVGSALARRLFESGRHVYAYDPAPEVGARIEDMGGSMLASEEDVANRCRCLIFSLPGATEVRTVVNRILPVLQRGNIIVDTTTGDPDDVEAIAAELSEAGVFYLDATLGGSSRQIAEGEGIVICGGSAEAFAAVEPMLRTLASTVFHTGAAGSGTRMKLAMNLAARSFGGRIGIRSKQRHRPTIGAGCFESRPRLFEGHGYQRAEDAERQFRT
jgi:3-hydroxyisobutyrate dehydrogenase-like beta-hydroxyacid dehydrogenase